MKDVYILGIESSCDETACAVVKNGTSVLSNVVFSQIDVHKVFGGVVPEIASRNHVEVVDVVTKQALKEAGLTLQDIDAIAVTYGAGLVGALLVGVSYAKGLAQSAKKPLIAVNHIEGHICSNYLSNPDLKPPFLCLLTSGGHTAIVRVDDYVTYTVLCSTADDAIGECFDKVARVLGLPYPGGIYVDKLAQNGKATIPFKSVVLANGNFSFSGIKTAVVNLVHNAEQKGETVNKEDLAQSFTKTAVDGLISRLQKEIETSKINKVAIAGGVAANSYLRQEVAKLEKQGVKVFLPKLCYCGDNGAMIASQGYFQFIEGDFASMDLNACPTLRLRAKYEKK
ncbi:MAG: tRNA (adenosine(37)-N6)-threonylcarbamoyltransferase complex transferase subunit TsaD [Clostridia bacterium]|nr:tRNA (adenosine(37)-N6)-threonylcarbamoyltransferase complex transferase subunit TsaD [Clostridia bacterium]